MNDAQPTATGQVSLAVEDIDPLDRRDPNAKPPPRATIADLKEAEAAVHAMQQMLGVMHAKKQGQSNEFKEMMEHYKHLNLTLQEVRKLYQDEINAQAKLARAQAQVGTRPSQLGGPTLGSRPGTGLARPMAAPLQ